MKHLKKIMSVLLTAIMVLAMCVPVMAAGEGGTGENTTYSITAPANGHTYKVYQIFTGTLSTDTDGNRILSNVKWGANAKQTGDVDSTVLTELKNLKDTAKTDKEILSVIKNYVNISTEDVNAYKTIASGTKVEVPAGYYLIKDADGSQKDENDSYTTYIVSIVGNLIIKPKADIPSSEKKVKDVNDSDGSATGWQDSADYDIGDDVPFQLTGKVASNYADYKVYKFVFHDRQSAGLTFNSDSVKVYVDGNLITSGYTVNVKTSDNDTFDIEFSDLKGISAVKANSVITVEYTSKLNDKAIIGSVGNPNTMHLEYSNNPNDDQGGETGKTPDDTVIVFTYKTVVNKVEEDGTALTGAEFKLEKFVAAADGEDTYKNITGRWVEKTLVKNTNGDIFTATGLDDGYYRLTETVAPEHYNKLKDAIYFEITATHDVESATPGFGQLNGNNLTGEVYTFTPDNADGSITTDVINKKGSQLPETGGIGTTIFYVVGVVLMLGAGVLLITKRRMSAKH